MLVKLIQYTVLIGVVFLSVQTQTKAQPDQTGITLQQAISFAHQHDPWLVANTFKQKAITEQGFASATWEDPKLSLGLLNMPTDTLNFEQEAMTQLKVGISQTLPRGDSLAIKQAITGIESTQFSLMAAERRAKVEVIVSELWLNAYLAQQTIQLINKDKILFEQLIDIARTSYATAAGKTRQQDIIRSELDLIQLEDQLLVYQQALSIASAKLKEWVMPDAYANQQAALLADEVTFRVANILPQLVFQGAQLTSQKVRKNHLFIELAQHPTLLINDAQGAIAKRRINLNQEKLKPQWRINAGYAYRDNTLTGDQRADLFSVGITVDMPIFTENKQDKAISAAIYQAEAIKTEKRLLLKHMISEVEKELHQLSVLKKRQALYRSSLLRQIDEQAESSLVAYTHDDGSFSSVVKAKVSALNMRIAALEIDINILKNIARLNYYFARYQPASTLERGQ